MNLPSAHYQKRTIRFLELWQHGSWRIKVYGIASGRPAPREELIEAAKRVAAERLASVAASLQHYFVGFLGVHDGRTSNFAFVDWWAHENELHVSGICGCWPLSAKPGWIRCSCETAARTLMPIWSNS